MLAVIGLARGQRRINRQSGSTNQKKTFWLFSADSLQHGDMLNLRRRLRKIWNKGLENKNGVRGQFATRGHDFVSAVSDGRLGISKTTRLRKASWCTRTIF